MLKKYMPIIFLFLSLFLFSCSNTVTYAPVSDVTMDPIPKSGIVVVKPNETLYSIAWRYGLDPYAIAGRNRLSSPYVYAGQKLYLKGKSPLIKKETPFLTPKMTPQIVPKTSPNKVVPISVPVAPVKPITPVKVNISKVPVAFWSWPARGRLVKGFSNSNKGINIGGYEGDPIYAAASGNVVYSGNGLHGYGNLIIIAHNLTYMSAYAYNRKIYVKEGQFVKSGQKIAEMGKNGARQVILHFEIRRQGQPVNPLKYLRS